MKFFLRLSYKGTHFHGWQTQPQHRSIQETLEAALAKMLGYKVNCIGCGRTDAGVHASQYFCHIKVAEEFPFDPVSRLNKMLPDDLAIHACMPVHWNAHAQKDALSRTYTYRIHTSKNAFLSEISTFYPKENLDMDTMKKAVRLLTAYDEFRGMCRQPDQYKSTRCHLTEAILTAENGGNQFRFDFTADRFLRGMVRIMVAQILETGYGRLSLEAFENCLKNGQPPPHLKAAPPQGLYLSAVRYDYIETPLAD